MERKGSSVEIINLSEQNLQMCIGCLRCWDKQDSREIRCVLSDGAAALLKNMLDSDLIIFASPLYYESVTGLMKIFLERMVMLHNADITQRDGLYSHDISLRVPPLAFVCSCDLPGSKNFEHVSLYMKRVAFDLRTELAAEIYQCEARLMRWPTAAAETLIRVQEQVWRRAGEELAEKGALSARTEKQLRMPLVVHAHYIKTANELAKETRERAGRNAGNGYGGY